MSWSFVGTGTTALINGTATQAISVPTGVANGDLLVLYVICYQSTAANIVQASFTTQFANHSTGSTAHYWFLGTRVASSEPGSYTVTLSSASSWGVAVMIALRSTVGVGTVANTASSIDNAGSYPTTLPSASLTIANSGDATIYCYGGTNSGGSGTNTITFAGTLANGTQNTETSGGNAAGIAWGTNVSAPASATVGTTGLDYSDFALDVTESGGGYTGTNGTLGTAAIPGYAQPGNVIPGQVNVTVTSKIVNAGLATGLGAAGGPGQGNRTAGLATGQGNAAQPVTPFAAGLATGTGTSQPPGQGNRTAGLATGTGAAGQPATPWLAGLATGTGSAGQLVVPSVAGLATGVATSQSPAMNWTAGLATGTGAAGAPAFTFTAGLATGSGTSQSPSWQGITALLASGSGMAFGPSLPAYTVNAGLATAIGAAGQPVTPWIAGLATGTSNALAPSWELTAGLATGVGTAAQPVTPFTAGLATGTGTSAQPATPWTAGLATGQGKAAQPGTPFAAGLATGTGTSQPPSWQGITALLATGQGKAAQPGTPFAVGLATGTGTSQPPSWQGIVALLATGRGTAFNPSVGATNRPPLNLGGSATPLFPYNGSFTEENLGGSVSYGNPLGGSAVPALNWGGSATLASPDTTSGGTATVLSSTLGGSVSYGNTLGGAAIGWTMQQVNLTLAENNDETVDFAITSNSAALDISTATINVYFKTAAGVIDSSALMFSSGGGSPAITITDGPGGLCTLAIPHADLYPETYTFYRLDVVFSGLQNTAIYGNLTWVTL